MVSTIKGRIWLLNREKTSIVDFEHGFQFLVALSQGEAIWIPWKHDRRKGRILFMARPLPPSFRIRYELPPPRSAMELAFAKAGRTVAKRHCRPSKGVKTLLFST